MLTTTADFAGIAFLTEPRKWSPIVSKVRVATSANTDVQWEIDYDTRKGYINSSTAFDDRFHTALLIVEEQLTSQKRRSSTGLGAPLRDSYTSARPVSITDKTSRKNDLLSPTSS